MPASEPCCPRPRNRDLERAAFEQKQALELQLGGELNLARSSGSGRDYARRG
jgi:hypothetical protein